MNQRKTVTLFLMDGDPTSKIKGTIANWTGVVYKIPRTKLEECNDREELKNSGVYFLIGTDENENDSIYIGQARTRKNGNALLTRIQEGHSSIDYWSEVLMLTTSNNSLGPTEISYLENRCCNLASKAGRYIVKNGNEPSQGNIREEDQASLEAYIEEAKIVIGAMGYRILEESKSQPSKERTYHATYNKVTTYGQKTSEGFLLLKGSQLVTRPRPACPKPVLRSRKKYDDKIDKSSDVWIAKEDIIFRSPSGALAFVCATAMNGYNHWKDEKGNLLTKEEI